MQVIRWWLIGPLQMQDPGPRWCIEQNTEQNKINPTFAMVALTAVVSLISRSRSISGSISNSSTLSSTSTPSDSAELDSRSMSSSNNGRGLSASSSELKPAANGLSRAFAASWRVWLKHRTWLTTSKELSRLASFLVWVLFAAALSALTARICSASVHLHYDRTLRLKYILCGSTHIFLA